MRSDASGVKSHRLRSQFVALLRLQAKLALREPYAVGLGIGFPIILLLLFGFISGQVPGNVAGTGLTVLDLWIPTIMVIGFVAIAVSLPSTLVRDREIGWLRRVSTTPLHPSRLLAAQLIQSLAIAVATVLIIIFGGGIVFGAPLHVGIPFFVLSIILSLAEILSLGLVVVALVPSQTVASIVTPVLFFPLLFLSGLWVNPVQVGEPLQSIMYYSPTGASAEALLYSVFNSTPPYTTFITMAVYTVIFAFIAIRYFRWE